MYSRCGFFCDFNWDSGGNWGLSLEIAVGRGLRGFGGWVIGVCHRLFCVLLAIWMGCRIGFDLISDPTLLLLGLIIEYFCILLIIYMGCRKCRKCRMFWELFLD